MDINGNGIQVLDGIKEVTGSIYEICKFYGGASYINDKIMVNYVDTGELEILRENKVELILPPQITVDRVEKLARVFDTLSANGYKLSKMVGYWLNNNGMVEEEENYILSTVINNNIEKLRLLIRVTDSIREDYKQEAVGLRFNNNLILVDNQLPVEMNW